MSEYNQPEFKKEKIDEEFYKDKIKEVLLNNKDYYKQLFKEIIFEIITEGTDGNGRQLCPVKSINDDDNNNGVVMY
jgi:hypothetical protein